MGFALLSLARSYFLEAVEGSLAAQADLIAHVIHPELGADEPSPSLPPAFNTLQQGQVDNLSVQMAGVDPAAEPGVFSHLNETNMATLADSSLQIAAALQTHVRILDAHGITLLDTAGGEDGVDLSSDALVSAALGGDRAAEVRSGSSVSELHVAVPLWSEGTVVGAITLSQPLSDVTAVLADLRSRLLLAAGLATLLAGGIGLFLAGGIARPLAALTLAADRLRAGDFDHPIGVEGRDELAQLAGSFASMRERMKNVEAMRTRFVSDVSHELRTPLTAIKGITETLQEGAIEDRQARGRFLDTIEAETDRLIRLVNDLLMLSRADSQRHQLRQQQVDLKAVMNSTYQLFSTQLQEKGIEWFKMVPPGDLTVHADPDRLAQLLSNLLDNACAHTPAQGEIWITAGQIHAQGGSMQPGRDRRRAFPTPADLPAPGAPLEDGAWLLLTIRDTGAGISATDLPHVFERFYRADKSRARGYGGSGLGLPIAKSLVEAHGGHIWLESPAKSQPRSAFPGTRAYVALPLSP